MTRHVNQMSVRELSGVSLPGDFVLIGQLVGHAPEMQDVVVSSSVTGDSGSRKPKFKYLTLTVCAQWDWIDLSERLG